MSNKCPKGYSRYTKSKKNIYFNKCCKSGLEPSEEVCLHLLTIQMPCYQNF